MKNSNCICREATEKDIPVIAMMSSAWEQENNCRGYRKNSIEYLQKQTIFVAEIENVLAGYLFGRIKTAENMSASIPDGTLYYQLEDLYVLPEYRSQGVGKSLVKYLENSLELLSVKYLFLHTATKDYKRILHFYIDELDMTFWSAALFKELN